MASIKTDKQYKAACERIEELLKIVSNATSADDKNLLELDMISDLVADYEETHFPIESPDPAMLIKLAIEEKNITQKDLAAELNLSPSRISDFINGRSVPSLKIAGNICRILEISPEMMLGIR
ncbi:MAG: helix-turn-helix domain-containing protein [Bacteroidia bacterium]|nr:helix-turn-helix domain-containing protein [Bacteroidia bacterium]